MWVCLSACVYVFSPFSLSEASSKLICIRVSEPLAYLGCECAFKVSTFGWHCFSCCVRSEIWQGIHRTTLKATRKTVTSFAKCSLSCAHFSLLSHSCANPREQEQLHPVLQQLGLAGEQTGETRVFLRYSYYYGSHTLCLRLDSSICDIHCTKLSKSFGDNPTLLSGDTSLKRCLKKNKKQKKLDIASLKNVASSAF